MNIDCNITNYIHEVIILLERIEDNIIDLDYKEDYEDAMDLLYKCAKLCNTSDEKITTK